MKNISKNILHCPRCKGFKVWEIESNIFCPECELTFNKTVLKCLSDDLILAIEELEGILLPFEEEGLDLKPFME
jgi:hypothetical protein